MRHWSDGDFYILQMVICGYSEINVHVSEGHEHIVGHSNTVGCYQGRHAESELDMLV